MLSSKILASYHCGACFTSRFRPSSKPGYSAAPWERLVPKGSMAGLCSAVSNIMQTSIRRRNTPQVVHDANSPNCSVQQLIIYRKPSRYSVDLTQHYAGGVSIPQSAIFLEPNRQAPLARHGARWAVLLLHGFTAGPASVLPWGLALAEAGATVHIPLLAG